MARGLIGIVVLELHTHKVSVTLWNKVSPVDQREHLVSVYKVASILFKCIQCSNWLTDGLLGYNLFVNCKGPHWLKSTNFQNTVWRLAGCLVSNREVRNDGRCAQVHLLFGGSVGKSASSPWRTPASLIQDVRQPPSMRGGHLPMENGCYVYTVCNANYPYSEPVFFCNIYG